MIRATQGELTMNDLSDRDRRAIDHLHADIMAHASPPVVAIGPPGYETDERGRPVVEVKPRPSILPDAYTEAPHPDVAGAWTIYGPGVDGDRTMHGRHTRQDAMLMASAMNVAWFACLVRERGGK